MFRSLLTAIIFLNLHQINQSKGITLLEEKYSLYFYYLSALLYLIYYLL